MIHSRVHVVRTPHTPRGSCSTSVYAIVAQVYNTNTIRLVLVQWHNYIDVGVFSGGAKSAGQPPTVELGKALNIVLFDNVAVSLYAAAFQETFDFHKLHFAFNLFNP